MKKSTLFLPVLTMMVFTFAAGGCAPDTGDIPIINGLYPYQMFYIYVSPLWTTNTGGVNNDETLDYEQVTGLSTGKCYLVDDDGLLAFGGSKQKWMLMTEEKDLPFTEVTLRSRRFAIRNVATGRFINVKGIEAIRIEDAAIGRQVLMAEFEQDDAFFCRINPQAFMGEGLPVISNANITMPNSFNAGILCLLGNLGYRTMKPSGNTGGRYAVQFLYGSENTYDPEQTHYSPNPQGCALFNFSAD